MSGMSADIPIKNDPKAHEAAMERVKLDKLREVKAGYDGTWIAHPQLHQFTSQAFDNYMVGSNQVCVALYRFHRHAQTLI